MRIKHHGAAMERPEPKSQTFAGEHRDTAVHLWLGLHLSWKAVFRAGMAAGAIFLLLELITAFIFGSATPFGPAYVTLRGLAGAEEVPGHYNPGLVTAGLFVHFLLSILVTFPLALFIHS